MQSEIRNAEPDTRLLSTKGETIASIGYGSGLAGAPCMPMPPEHRGNSGDGPDDEYDNQGGILDPGNRRNAERHDQSEQADLPGQHMGAGGEGAERQQRENGERSGA